MRAQVEIQNRDDRALEWLLSVGFVGLVSLVGSQLLGVVGVVIGATFCAMVFAQGRMLSRNFVVQMPFYAIAAQQSITFTVLLLLGHSLILPLATGHGFRRVAALIIGEMCSVGLICFFVPWNPVLVLTLAMLVRMVSSMVVARLTGLPLDVGSVSGIPAAVASLAVCLVGVWIAALSESVLLSIAQIGILSLVWLCVMRAYQTAASEFTQGLIGLGHLLTHAHPYTGGHSRRVGYLARETGRRVGIPEWRLDEVVHAALLHDIGKLAVDERILEKPTKLTDAEFAVIKTHPAIGEAIVEAVLEHKPLAKWIRHHHERMDGRGYPDALVQKDIPMESRLIAVLDAYDAMTGSSSDGHRRLYRDPVTSAKALEELRRCAGTQFDAQVVHAFEQVLGHGRGGVV